MEQEHKNKQIEESWNEEMIRAFMKLGEKYPEIAAEIYVVAGWESGMEKHG